MRRLSTRWLLGYRSSLAVPAVLFAIASAACGGTSTPPPSGGVSTGPPNYVPWLALDPKHLVATLPEPTPPVPVPAGTPICRASQLEGAARGPYAAAGNVNFPVVLRNRDTSPCYLDGYADVTVLGVGGAQLAQVGGSTGQGTFFDDGTVVQVLMDSGTPPLAAQPPVTAFSPARGQAFMDLTWDDCKAPKAAQLVLDLPGSGRLVIPFSMQANTNPACDSGAATTIALARGPITPAGVQMPTRSYLAISISVSAPATVRAGSTLVYWVTVGNMTQADYRLDPCPDYTEFLAGKTAVASYQMNCAPVGHISPGVSRTFEMRIGIPKDLPAGNNTLTWTLADPRLATPAATASLVIT